MQFCRTGFACVFMSLCTCMAMVILYTHFLCQPNAEFLLACICVCTCSHSSRQLPRAKVRSIQSLGGIMKHIIVRAGASPPSGVYEKLLSTNVDNTYAYATGSLLVQRLHTFSQLSRISLLNKCLFSFHNQPSLHLDWCQCLQSGYLYAHFTKHAVFNNTYKMPCCP